MKLPSSLAQLVLIITFLTTGCVAPTIRSSRVDRAPAKPHNGPVTVFAKGEVVPGDYEVLGVVSALLGSSEALPFLKKGKAADMGANALVGYYKDRIDGRWIAYRWSSALAVRQLPQAHRDPRTLRTFVSPFRQP